MKLYPIFILSIIVTFGFFPAFLNSADIYEETSDGSKILTSLNENIITDNDKFNSTLFVIKT
ncbi:TPA: hypothetical protein DCZ31_02750 [Patescibacteria group bacterium]|nr:hypothetical protein [Candidatus Gracilibacteria bacterium]